MYASNPSTPDGPELMYHQLKKFINIIVSSALYL